MEVRPWLQHIGLKRQTVDSYDHYPFNIPAIRKLPDISFRKDVTFMVGENGTGKSTFIEGIAPWLGLSLEGGSKNNVGSNTQSEYSISKHLWGSMNFRGPSDYFFQRAESL